MQLDKAEEESKDFVLLFLFSTQLCNLCNVTVTGNSLELPAVYN